MQCSPRLSNKVSEVSVRTLHALVINKPLLAKRNLPGYSLTISPLQHDIRPGKCTKNTRQSVECLYAMTVEHLQADRELDWVVEQLAKKRK